MDGAGMEVSYGDEQSFEAEYHGPGRLWQEWCSAWNRRTRSSSRRRKGWTPPFRRTPSPLRLEDEDVPAVEEIALVENAKLAVSASRPNYW